jgi:hypothetical protein
MLKRPLTILVGALTFLGISDALASSWYVGAERPGSYGVWAYIKTPPVAPFLVSFGASGEANWVSTQAAPNWIQAGWRYYHWYGDAQQYTEMCYNNCTAYLANNYGTQNWNVTVQYMVQHMPGTTDQWCAYVAGIRRDCQSILVPPTTVQVYSEIHTYPLNGLETTFNPIYYKDSAEVWRLFDSNVSFPSPHHPYKRSVFQNWDFLTYRSVTFERYIPLTVK